MIKSINSKSSKDATFTWSPSLQSDLFGYLKPQQREALRPFLRIVKRPYQEKLCASLLDYIEGNGLDPLSEPVLASLQEEIVQVCSLRPLTSSKGLGFRGQGLGKNSLNSPLELARFPQKEPSSLILHQPKSIGAIIKQLFPSLKGLSSLNPQL